MALSKGVNSYVEVEEADSYFEDRLDVAAWTEAPAEQKSRALVTATGILDNLQWAGTATSEDQPLAHPRRLMYLDVRMGRPVTLKDEVSPRVVKGCMELAHHLLNNDGILDETGSVTSLNVGSVALGRPREPPKIPQVVKWEINPLLIRGGAKSWWRYN